MGKLLFAFLLYSSLLTPSLALAQGGEEKAPATVEETPAPVPEEKATAIPAQAPAPTPEKKRQIEQITLEELRGLISYTYRDNVILLRFWSPYCGECLELLPMFSELYRNYRDQGVCGNRYFPCGIS
ncbi:MAG: thioredoxin domain-containing protein [Candidatus Brocadiales bacterium]